MSTAGSASGRDGRRAMVAGSMVGRSPCTLTTMSRRPSGSSSLERLEDAVGAGGVVGPGHHRLAAGAASRPSAIAGASVATTTRPTPASHGAPPDMHDHRLAGDVGERLAGQPRRRQAGGDEDDRIGHGGAHAATGACRLLAGGRPCHGVVHRAAPRAWIAFDHDREPRVPIVRTAVGAAKQSCRAARLAP